MKKRKKTITLDNLAAMVAEGFNETATKQDISRLDRRIDGVDKHIERLDKKIVDLAERIGRVEAKLDRALYKEVARLEGLIRQLAEKTKVKLEY